MLQAASICDKPVIMINAAKGKAIARFSSYLTLMNHERTAGLDRDHVQIGFGEVPKPRHSQRSGKFNRSGEEPRTATESFSIVFVAWCRAGFPHTLLTTLHFTVLDDRPLPYTPS